MTAVATANVHRVRALAQRALGSVHNRSMAWSVIDQFLVSAANFAIGIVAARLLGVASFGQFTLTLMLAALAAVFVEYIFCAPMMTLAGRRARRSQSYYAAVAALGIAAAVVGGLAVALVKAGMLFARDGSLDWLLMASAFAVTFGHVVHTVARRILFARRRAKSALVVDVTRYGLFSLVVVALLFMQVTPSAELMLVILGATGVMATVAVYASLLANRVRMKLLVAVVSRHWPIASWLVLMVVVAMGQEQIVWLIVGGTLGDAAVGGLRAGQYLLGVTHFIMLALENFVPRGASDAYSQGGVDGLGRFLMRQMVILGIPTFGLIILVAAPAHFWLGTLFGPEYAQFAPILWVWSLAYAIVFVREMWVYYLRTIEQTRGTFHAFALSSAAAMLLIYPAIMSFGVIGAAAVVCLAHFISMAYVLRLVHLHVRRERPAAALDEGAPAARSALAAG